MRAPKDRFASRAAWEFFRALDASGEPQWTRDIGQRDAVFRHTDHCLRSAITYNAGLRRYLWWPRWDVGPGEHGDFPAKWMSADGRTLHLVFSGDDCFSVREATLVLR